jgi:hypothetical protein
MTTARRNPVFIGGMLCLGQLSPTWFGQSAREWGLASASGQDLAHAVAALELERRLVERQAAAAIARTGGRLQVDAAVLEALVTAFRDLRSGRSAEGCIVEKPGTVMSTAEAVGVATSLGLRRMSASSVVIRCCCCSATRTRP